MTSTRPTSSKRCLLLALPLELRNLIYDQLFSSPPPYLKFLCPTRRRLRCTQTSPSNPLPILETCRQLRDETFPLIYGDMPLCFRNAQSTINFIYDPSVELDVRMGIKHLALDVGDVRCLEGHTAPGNRTCTGRVTEEWTKVLETAATTLGESIEVVECRIWCLEGRRNDLHTFMNVEDWFNDLQLALEIAQGREVMDPAITRHLTHFWEGLGEKTASLLKEPGWRIKVHCSTASYGTALVDFGRERDELLRCFTVVMSRNGTVNSCFGGAEQAVVDRQKMVGKPPTVAMQLCEATMDDILDRVPTMLPGKISTLRTQPRPDRSYHACPEHRMIMQTMGEVV